MTITEEEVRTRLRRFADQARTDPSRKPSTVASDLPSPRHLVTRARVAIVVAILVVAGVTAATVAVSSNNHGRNVKTNVETNGTATFVPGHQPGQTTTAPPNTSPSTQPTGQHGLLPGELPLPSIQPNELQVTTWTGSQWLVWGGLTTTQGGAYTPALKSWQTLPPAPIADSRAIATWDGTKWLIFGGASAGASYDPTTRQWAKTAPLPVSSQLGQVVWTGSAAIVVTTKAAESYNPNTNRWTVLSVPPSSVARTNAVNSAVWSGTELYIPVGTLNGLQGLAALDVATNRWTTIPAPSGAPATLEVTLEAYNGQILVLDSGSNVQPLGPSYSYNPANHSWRQLASAPSLPGSMEPGSGEVWTGHDAIFWTGGTAAMFYNAATNTWGTFSVANGGSPNAFDNTVEVWTGTEVLAWGEALPPATGSTVLALHPPN